MKTLSLRLMAPLAAALLSSAAAAPAMASVVTFDDDAGNAQYGTSFDGPFADQGLTFNAPDGLAYVYSAPDGSNDVIYGEGSFGLVITKTAGGTFDLNSLDLGLSFNSDLPQDTLTVSALINGVTTSQTLTLTQDFQHFSLDLLGVTSVTISPLGEPQAYYGLDNLDVTNVDGGVPEPASWALMIVGFGGIGAALRRRSTPRVWQ